MSIKQYLLSTAGVGLVAVGMTLSIAPITLAAVLAVGDADRWQAGGANAIGNLGYNMLPVPDNAVPGGFSPVTQIPAPSNTLNFNNTVQKAYVGTDWAKLAGSRFTTGVPIYFNSSDSLTINLANSVSAFDLVVESNSLAPLVFNIGVTAFGTSTANLVQGVKGDVGGQYFGFYATNGDLISSITITAPSVAEGFAVGEFRVGSAPTPVPFGFSPTLGLVTLGLGYGANQYRKKSTKKVLVFVKKTG